MNVRFTAADGRLRTSATRAGSTRTAVPTLLPDWKKSVVAAAARQAAREELAPEVDDARAEAERRKGEPLDDLEAYLVGEEVYRAHAQRLEALERKHAAVFGKKPEETVRGVVSDYRAYVDKRRDPFTPLVDKQAPARNGELVLWENEHALVVVDLFAYSPKALVVPKQKTMFPSDAKPDLLDELARVAAQVSDAFASTAHTPPAGIWVNPPQDLTVKQMHVHVQPDLPPWAELLSRPDLADKNLPTKTLLQDGDAGMRIRAQFDLVHAALEKTLGPSS